jgi:hypothetical protein
MWDMECKLDKDEFGIFDGFYTWMFMPLEMIKHSIQMGYYPMELKFIDNELTEMSIVI